MRTWPARPWELWAPSLDLLFLACHARCKRTEEKWEVPSAPSAHRQSKPGFARCHCPACPMLELAKQSNALQTAPKTVDNISTMLPSHHTISNPFKCRILSSLRSPKRTPLISASPRSLQTLHALPLFRFFEQNTSQKWTPTFPKRCQKKQRC